MYTIHRIHRDEYGTILWTTPYGPYPTREAAEDLAYTFSSEYGYECIVKTENERELN